MKREHEQSCAYEPCYCPVPGCGFDGSYKDLYRHFAREHPDSATHFTFDSYFPVHVREDMESMFLQERDHTLFILNYGVQNFGSVAYIICMGPSCLRDKYSYELEASSVNRGSFKFSWPWIESLTKWTVDLSDKNGLVLPKVFTDSSWDQKIKVCIRRKGENWLDSSSGSSWSHCYGPNFRSSKLKVYIENGNFQRVVPFFLLNPWLNKTLRLSFVSQ